MSVGGPRVFGVRRKSVKKDESSSIEKENVHPCENRFSEDYLLSAKNHHKKTPFHVCQDENNLQKESAPLPEQSLKSPSDTLETQASKIPVRIKTSLFRAQPRLSLLDGESGLKEKKIRRNSVDSSRKGKTSSKKEPTREVHVGRETFTKKSSLSSLRLRTGVESLSKKESLESASGTIISENSTGLQSGITGFPQDKPSKQKHEENRLYHDNVSTMRVAGSVITPADGLPPAPPLMPVKALIRRRARGTSFGQLEKEKKKLQADARNEHFPAELAYHLEYQEDLLRIEREREERAPELSSGFLTRYINALQRRQVVIYLLHLGNHCRYPSPIIYQTVKLFDATMDRLAVHTVRIQLTALAALWISLKKQEIYHKIPSATTILALAKELYIGREDLLRSYERKVLEAVNFNISFADIFSLLSYYIINCKRRIGFSEETTILLYHLGGYVIDLTLLNEQFCRSRPSLLALIAAEIGMVLLLDHASDSETAVKPRWQYWRELLCDTDSSESFLAQEISGLRTTILRLIRESGKKQSEYEVVYKKYSRTTYGRVASLIVERTEQLHFAQRNLTF